ncbi:MAG: hypothetical protein GY953_49370 [bacterium]|nr:hypothetical protein [bacterium]
MKQRKEDPQVREQWYICSDLVSVRWQRSGKQERVETAVLEEIGPGGALVQLESEVACQTAVRLDCPAAGFDGGVREATAGPLMTIGRNTF